MEPMHRMLATAHRAELERKALARSRAKAVRSAHPGSGGRLHPRRPSRLTLRRLVGARPPAA